MVGPNLELLKEEEKDAMGRMAVLIDEVVLEFAEAKKSFQVEAALGRIREVFLAHNANCFDQMGYYPWCLAIRSRLSKLGFELARDDDGGFGWKLPTK